MEINLEEVMPSDRISIKTENSLYYFSVLEPEQRKGILTGGTLGNQQREAVLMSSLEGSGREGTNAFTVLKTGARALFFMTAKNGFERLITSVITQISLLKKEGDARHAA
ncbi:MAG TPA: hypothetical protein VNH22_02775 [Blastocatellia bacterium]|jgi:hypothetical protein|nr:hypothetical protein [Blastocatellia bacterium]